jgi:hypothetical protein
MLPIYVVTSLAASRTGSRRMTQYELAQIAFPPLPSALTMDGQGATFLQPPHSNVYAINGNNANSCADPTPFGALPAIGATTNSDVTNIDASIPSGRYANYTGVDGTTPDVANDSTNLGPYSTVGGLEGILAMIQQNADQVVPSGGTPPLGWGTTSNPLVTYVNGDVSGSCQGSGILVVTGALSCGGNYSWNGIILVVGKGYVTASGGGNGQITGGVLVANLYNHVCGPGDTSCTSSSLLPTTSQPGAPTFDWSGGGGNGIVFDACWTTKWQNKFSYQIVASREVMY